MPGVCNYLSPLFSQNFIFPLDNSGGSAYDECTLGLSPRFFTLFPSSFVWEVSIINKQKFLAELAKLLTFMYEEDRQLALGAYNEMFDEAEDEQQLLHALVSPLRQAVEVARAYNSGKQTLNAEPRTGESEDKSKTFLDTIHRIRAEALSAQPRKPEVSKNQLSLFDTPEEAGEAEPEAETEEVDGESAEASEAAEEAEAPAAESEPEEAAAEEAKPEEPAEAPAAESEPEAEPEEAPVPEAAPPRPVPPVSPVRAVPQPEEAARLTVEKTVRKPRVLLLILYILIAVPLTLAAVVLLLAPALASLAVSVACIAVAVFAVTSSIGSFPTIANLLVAIGAALILLAFGLLFLMLFVWLLGGAIGGLISGVISLGGKWCYKEVAAE